MGRIKRIVDVDFWTDDKVVEMFSPEDKLFFIYLLTNPHTTQLGIYPISRKVMAFELGYSIDTVSVLLDRFENTYGMIKYMDGEIAIKNCLRHSIVKGGKPVEDLLIREINQVKHKSLLKWVYESVKNSRDLNETVSKILPLLNANENDNDNDNDESYHDSYDDSSHDSYDDSSHDSYDDSYHDSSKRKKFVPPTEEEVDAYCAQRGNGITGKAFVSYYEMSGWRLKNGQQMKSWKAAISYWESRNKEKEDKEKSSQQDLEFWN